MVNKVWTSLKTSAVKFGPKNGEEDITVKIGDGGKPKWNDCRHLVEIRRRALLLRRALDVSADFGGQSQTFCGAQFHKVVQRGIFFDII